LNLRGRDVDFNPVFFSFVLVDSKQGFTLWCQEVAVTEEIKKEVSDLGGKIEKYENVVGDLGTIKGKIVTDSKVNMAIVEAIGEVSLSSAYQDQRHKTHETLSAIITQERIEIVKSPVETAQAIKNSTEIQGLRNAYLRDGVAWAHWAAWLEGEVATREVTEWEAAEKLTRYREKNENYAGVSR